MIKRITTQDMSFFKMAHVLILVIACAMFAGFGLAHAEETEPRIAAMLDAYNVTWDTPGPTSRESMPLGNGDIGLNVWTEPSGDLVFFIGKTDAWNENYDLLKLGAIRVSLNPSPLSVQGAPFRQILRLRQGDILVERGPENDRTQLKIWVDARRPVIHIEARSSNPTRATVSLQSWRTGNDADMVLATETNRVVWYHRNKAPANRNWMDGHLAALSKEASLRL